MLRAALGLVGQQTSLPAVQHLLGVAQQCGFATSTPPYLRDAAGSKATKKAAKGSSAPSKSASTAKPKAEKPARALSAYTLFVKEKAAGVVRQPGAGPADMMKALAREWKSLSDAQKAPWVTKADAMKAELQQARAAAAGPKRPLNAYNVYYKEQYPLLASRGLKVTEVAKEIANMWKTLPQHDKDARKAAADAALAKWKAEGGM